MLGSTENISLLLSLRPLFSSGYEPWLAHLNRITHRCNIAILLHHYVRSRVQDRRRLSESSEAVSGRPKLGHLSRETHIVCGSARAVWTSDRNEEEAHRTEGQTGTKRNDHRGRPEGRRRVQHCCCAVDSKRSHRSATDRVNDFGLAVLEDQKERHRIRGLEPTQKGLRVEIEDVRDRFAKATAGAALRRQWGRARAFRHDADNAGRPGRTRRRHQGRRLRYHVSWIVAEGVRHIPLSHHGNHERARKSTGPGRANPVCRGRIRPPSDRQRNRKGKEPRRRPIRR